MIRRAILAGTILAGLMLAEAPARAQLIVNDPINTVQSVIKVSQGIAAAAARAQSLANQGIQISNQLVQMAHLYSLLAAAVHGDWSALAQVVPALGNLGIELPIGTDASQLVSALGGLMQAGGQLGQAFAQLNQLGQQFLNTDQLFKPMGGDFAANNLNAMAQANAGQKAVWQTALDASGKRLAALQQLRQAIPPAVDAKASSDVAARWSAETAMGVAQLTQYVAASNMAMAQNATMQQQAIQMDRCTAHQMFLTALKAKAAADAGQIQFVTQPDSANCANIATTTLAGAYAASMPADGGGDTSLTSSFDAAGANGTDTSDTGGGDTSGSGTSGTSGTPQDASATLAKMTSQSWGQQAASNATALGVNPVALAATCVAESGCSTNVGGSGTVSGAFQMMTATQTAALQAAAATNPDLVAAASGEAKNNPDLQSIAAASYLRTAAQQLQNAGIAQPTALDVRAVYNFGPKGGLSIDQASPDMLMSDALPNLSAANLKANGITAGITTVGQWKASVSSKIGGAASAPVLL